MHVKHQHIYSHEMVHTSWVHDKTLGYQETPLLYFFLPGCVGVLLEYYIFLEHQVVSLICRLCHRSTFVLGCGYDFTYDLSTLYPLCGHDLVSCIMHGSIVYYLVALLSFYYRAWVCLPRRCFLLCKIYYVCFPCPFTQNLQALFLKCFFHQTYLLASHFRWNLQHCFTHFVSNLHHPKVTKMRHQVTPISPRVFHTFGLSQQPKFYGYGFPICNS